MPLSMKYKDNFTLKHVLFKLSICPSQTKCWTCFQFHLNVWWNARQVVEACRGSKDLVTTSLHLLMISTHYNSFHIFYSCFAILSVLDVYDWENMFLFLIIFLFLLFWFFLILFPCFPFVFIFFHHTTPHTNVLKQMLNSFGSLLVVPCRQWNL
jgi:hypothetical protein